jgi:hypothetical protein
MSNMCNTLGSRWMSKVLVLHHIFMQLTGEMVLGGMCFDLVMRSLEATNLSQALEQHLRVNDAARELTCATFNGG